ncbi:hypothetical protein BWO91_14790 [Plantibacter flavus]|uniref:hypothetical protein n=1 Tax=Plantibacter TaxID=190323 RepID=UPI00099B67F0|nr:MULTISPECIES: hypothetical protein [Plantibacter]AQX81070.1 hypothetical protein BWO91_14790 [Plantibacter flavus]
MSQQSDSSARNGRRSGKKRAAIATGSLLGVAILASTAAFTDYGILGLGGSGGFGGRANAYNLQVSAGQENTTASVAAWVEANPTAVDVAPIAGADRLVPGGAPVIVKLPFRNESTSLKSTTSVTFVDVNANPSSADAAYAGLLRFDIAEVEDASTIPTTWLVSGLRLAAGQATVSSALSTLSPGTGRVLVVRAYLVNGATQEATNAANGGSVQIHARFDGQSID